MAWLGKDFNKTEWIFAIKPFRHNLEWTASVGDADDWVCIMLPSGSIQKLIGRELTWEDSPVEI